MTILRLIFFASFGLINLATSSSLKASTIQDTVVTSDSLEMQSSPDGHTFHFTGHIKVVGKDMNVTCDQLYVWAALKSTAPTSDTSSSHTPQVGAVERIEAFGNVVVHQDNRTATAGKAELFPKEGRIVLSDKPIVINEEGRVDGYRIVLFQGEKKIIVEGDPNARARVILPSFEKLSDEASEPGSSTPETAPAPVENKSEEIVNLPLESTH